MAYTLSARGAAFRDLFNKAGESFAKGDIEESERLHRQLLMHADLGDYFKAGCHLVLGLGSDNFLWHAEQAVDLYENLYVVRPGSSYTRAKPPTAAELTAQEGLLAQARKNLEEAQKDYAEIRRDYEKQFEAFRRDHGREPTDSELSIALMNRDRGPVDEYLAEHDALYEQYLRGPDDANDGSEDDSDEELGIVPVGDQSPSSQQSQQAPKE